ncbi:MAG: adenylate kinase [Candidatus Odinarchaeota archaeon]|nr:adenylate kinase [Candidatus Odinarchaeota archaeon]
MYIIIFGPPGAGKGTQARKIAHKFNLKHIATGDLLRKEIELGTEIGRTAEIYLKKGDLVPDHIVIELVKQHLCNPEGTTGAIFDGFPRTLKQAFTLDSFLESKGRKIDMVISLDISDQEVIKRLTMRRICKECGQVYHLIFKRPKNDLKCDICGGELIQREDDKEEVVRNRLAIYHERTTPLLDFYSKKKILYTVDGTKDVETIYNNIVQLIERVINRAQ